MNEKDDTLRDLVVGGTTYRTTFPRKYVQMKPPPRPDASRLTARIPGTVVEVLVEPGQAIERGTGIVILEAMKMRNSITAAGSGTVKAIHVEPGRLVAKGDLLIEID